MVRPLHGGAAAEKMPARAPALPEGRNGRMVMLVNLVIRNFKRFGEVEVELGNPVVFVGPNNSGKTSALQALALWEAGLRRWNEKRAGAAAPERQPGVTINRRDLTAVPVPSAALIWRGRRTRNVRRIDGAQRTDNVRVDIVVEGVSGGRRWTCGFEFDYANEESFYCRPLRTDDRKPPGRMPVPAAAASTRIAFLPPMSGLAANETRLDDGAVNVRVGEGRTAEVLRNLCWRARERSEDEWEGLAGRIRDLFGAALRPPRYLPERGEIEMEYVENGVTLDLSSSGRGLQQTLLILAYMHANPGAVALLDEPDAHLEILRQRQIYRLLVETAEQHGSQVVAASHSEAVLNEAAGRDTVVTFVGRPHRIGRQTDQVYKALAEIGFEDYAQGEQNGWVLYLEGSTDLALLQAFAHRLRHERAVRALERPFVSYVGNRPGAAERHYFGLREALPELRGAALFDRRAPLQPRGPLRFLIWRKREFENYVCTPATLEAFACAADAPMPLFAGAEAGRRLAAMRDSIAEVESALATLGKGEPWSSDIKASDDVLTPLFRSWFGKLRLPNLVSKTSFHKLVEYVPAGEIDAEIAEKLDAIADVADAAAAAPLP